MSGARLCYIALEEIVVKSNEFAEMCEMWWVCWIIIFRRSLLAASQSCGERQSMLTHGLLVTETKVIG